MSAAREAVDCCIEAVDSKDLDALTAVFADEAVLLPPQSEPLVGVDAITRYYRDLVFALGPSPRAVRHVTEGDTCVVELEVTLGDTVAHFADVFTIGDAGRVTRLAIYRR